MSLRVSLTNTTSIALKYALSADKLNSIVGSFLCPPRKCIYTFAIGYMHLCRSVSESVRRSTL